MYSAMLFRKVRYSTAVSRETTPVTAAASYSSAVDPDTSCSTVWDSISSNSTALPSETSEVSYLKIGLYRPATRHRDLKEKIFDLRVRLLESISLGGQLLKYRALKASHSKVATSKAIYSKVVASKVNYSTVAGLKATCFTNVSSADIFSRKISKVVALKASYS